MTNRTWSLIGALLAGAAFASAHAGEAPTPSSVSESAPQKTGKEPSGAPTKAKDSKDLPNPKTPASVSESGSDKSADADKKGRKKRTETKPY